MAALAGVLGRDPRILFIPYVTPAPTSERTPVLLELLRERYPLVALSAPWDRIVYDPTRPPWARALLYVLDKVLLILRGVLEGRRFRANLVFCESAHHALAGVGIARLLGARCVWDSHGNGALFFEAMGKRGLFARLTQRLESFLGHSVDELITVSKIDADAYVGMGLPREKVHVIPTCAGRSLLENDGGDPAKVSPLPVILFFGSFTYEPNRDALEFINRTLAPYLDRQGVRCEILIAGRDVPRGPFHPSIRVIGFVPDIYAQIRSATLSIVPVRKGVGILTKVVDVMACGTPVVMFAFARRGIPGIQHGVNAYVASSEEEFLRGVKDAVSDEGMRGAMAHRAREL